METDYYQVLGVNLQPDHYQVLGVQPTDDRPAMRDALRRKAMENHPDRGGSVEAMQRINFAWEILSNPEKRSRYDALRANPENAEALHAANVDAQQAKERVNEYPRKWEEYDAWLNALASDFKNAKYESTKLGNTNIEIPIVTDSATGCLFVLIGAVLGGWFVGYPVYSWLAEHIYRAGRVKPLPILAASGCALGGAWLGVKCHQALGSKLTSTRKDYKPQEQPSPVQSRIVACNKCHQKLRIPGINSELSVTCTKCHNKFSCPPE